MTPELKQAMQAAVHALRSYQYGNISEELADDVADKLEQELLTEKTHDDSRYTYVVQDLEGTIVGVFTNLADAGPVFQNTYCSGVVLLEMYDVTSDDDEDPFSDCITHPFLTVWKANDMCVGSYENPDEVNRALIEGEKYDD
jgi:hypothetical protein